MLFLSKHAARFMTSQCNISKTLLRVYTVKRNPVGNKKKNKKSSYRGTRQTKLHIRIRCYVLENTSINESSSWGSFTILRTKIQFIDDYNKKTWKFNCNFRFRRLKGPFSTFVLNLATADFATSILHFMTAVSSFKHEWIFADIGNNRHSHSV